MKKVLVVGPGRRTRGGITSVIKAHRSTKTWKKWSCLWVSSYIDRSGFWKIAFFLKAIFIFTALLPFYDLVHIHFSEPTSARRKFVFLKLAKLLNKKILLHLHSFSSETSLFGPKGRVYKNMIDSSDGIIALSDSWRKEIEKLGIEPAKIHVLYNPCPKIDHLNFPKKKQLLYAGTLNERKGYSLLLKAFAEMARFHEDWRLVFAGNGEIAEAEKLATELGIRSKVDFKGWVAGQEKHALFSESRCFCLPSKAEGFPMAVLDAFAYGLPVITTPVGGLPDILEHGSDVLFFNPDNVNELSMNINDLLNSPQLMDQLALASLRLSRTVFNVDEVGATLDSIYSDILDKN